MDVGFALPESQSTGKQASGEKNRGQDVKEYFLKGAS